MRTRSKRNSITIDGSNTYKNFFELLIFEVYAYIKQRTLSDTSLSWRWAQCSCNGRVRIKDFDKKKRPKMAEPTSLTDLVEWFCDGTFSNTHFIRRRPYFSYLRSATRKKRNQLNVASLIVQKLSHQNTLQLILK